MRKSKLRFWTHEMVFLLIGTAIVLTVLLGAPKVMGAGYEFNVGSQSQIDSMQYVPMIDQVAQDSSDWYEDFYSVKCTVAYTAGDHLRVDVKFKYVGQDNMITISNFVEYNSAAASTFDSATAHAAAVAAAAANPSLHLDGASGGTYAVTIVAYDSSTSQNVPNVNITIRPLDQSSLSGVASIDETGSDVVNLNVGNYLQIVNAPGWDQVNTPESLEVSGGMTDTVLLDQFDPSAPTLANVCNVYGWIVADPSGDTTVVKNKHVQATPTKTAYNICDSVSFQVQTVDNIYTNASGRFEIPLYYSSCLAESHSTTSDTINYILNIDGRTWEITVPDSSTFRVVWQ